MFSVVIIRDTMLLCGHFVCPWEACCYAAAWRTSVTHSGKIIWSATDV